MSDEQEEEAVEPEEGGAPSGPRRRQARVRKAPSKGGGSRIGTPKVDPAAGWGAFSDAWSRGERSVARLAAQANCSTKTIKRYIAKLEAGKAPVLGKVISAPKQEPPLAKMPPEGWDHMEVAARAANTDRLAVNTRLQAVRILEERRRWELEHGEKGQVDWATVTLAEIPHEHRARLAGMLAETLVEERAPQLGLAETTEAQATVFYLIGKVVPSSEADELVRDILQPALAAAVRRADELALAREMRAKADGPRDSELRPEEWLTHV